MYIIKCTNLNFDHEMEKIIVRGGPKNHSGNF
jgi:hypothetical protein